MTSAKFEKAFVVAHPRYYFDSLTISFKYDDFKKLIFCIGLNYVALIQGGGRLYDEYYWGLQSDNSPLFFQKWYLYLNFSHNSPFQMSHLPRPDR